MSAPVRPFVDRRVLGHNGCRLPATRYVEFRAAISLDELGEPLYVLACNNEDCLARAQGEAWAFGVITDPVQPLTREVAEAASGLDLSEQVVT